MNLGQCIRRARQQKGLTLTDVARQLGRTKQWLSELERGNIRLTYEVAVSLTRVFGTTMEELFGLSAGETDSEVAGS